MKLIPVSVGLTYRAVYSDHQQFIVKIGGPICGFWSSSFIYYDLRSSTRTIIRIIGEHINGTNR